MDDHEFLVWLKKCPDIGTALHQLRVMQGLTEEEVAHYAYLDKSYVSKLERGLRHPTRDTLIKLALSAFSLSVPQANELLMFAGHAPLR